MSKINNIPETSFWAKKKAEFLAGAKVNAFNCLARYEVMQIAERADRPMSINQFCALMKILDKDCSDQRTAMCIRQLWDSGLLKRKFDEDDKKEKKNPLYFLNEATLEDDFDPSEIDLLAE